MERSVQKRVQKNNPPQPKLELLQGGAAAENHHRRIIIGAEVEAYSIALTDYSIGRRTSRPQPGMSERGERFTRDTSIGSEYNSKPFATVREALFLLKAGLRKYLRDMFRGETDENDRLIPLLVGGWTNRSAGTHLHLSFADRDLDEEGARALAEQVHDHIPLLLAVSANSPVWDRKLTKFASNRVLKGSAAYFAPLPRGEVSKKDLQELRFSPARKTKPATIELRMLDSNVPEFIVASMVILKAIAMRRLCDEDAVNPLVDDATYLKAREDAAMKGMRARLPWRGQLKPARTVLKLFLREYKEELDAMDVPNEIWDVFHLLENGYNGSRIISEAIKDAKREHAQTWQRRFAKRYSEGLEQLLNGNSLRDFAAALHVELPPAHA
jgi:Glutamate-cysteine ligase family 2(GCS2)